MLKRALSAFRSEHVTPEEELRWLWLACHAALDLWDDESWDVLAARHVELAREAGALAVLPLALNTRVGLHLCAGELAAAASLVEEVKTVDRGDREPARAVRRAGARRLAGPRGRGRRADRGHA